jgi:hypothetical protein
MTLFDSEVLCPHEVGSDFALPFGLPGDENNDFDGKGKIFLPLIFLPYLPLL